MNVYDLGGWGILMNLNRKIAPFLNFITSPSFYSKKVWNFVVTFARLLKFEPVN